MLLALLRQVLVNRAGQKQNHYHGCRDPHEAVQIRVPFEHVEEVGARIDGRGAAAQHLSGVDIEGLRVEGERPQQVFAAAAGA